MKIKLSERKKEEFIKNGSCRNKMWFALLPVKIENEIRWLCVVRVKQKYYEASPPNLDKNSEFYRDYQVGWWENVEFLEP